ITLDANFLIPDELFIKSFNNDIAAEFFCDKDYHRITMQEAFDQKLIVNHMNTFQVVKRVRRIFDPEKFSLCFLQTICSVNMKCELNLQNVELYDQMANEYELVRKINEIAKDIHTPIMKARRQGIEKVSPCINLHTFLLHKINVVEQLIINKWIKLLYAIIIQDLQLTILGLNEVDPRINNNEAYRLAVEVGNEEIINIISELIIRKTWHEK